jgi:hypothetical protein
MSGDSELDDMIARIRLLEGGAEATAKAAAPLVEAAVKSTAAARTSPDGVAWPAKKDGSPALVNAAEAVKAEAVGSAVRLRLVGTPTGDQLAQAIQNAKRPILPVAGRLGKPVTEALSTAARGLCNRSVGR